MEKIEFKTVEELYKRVSPALYSKLKEIKRMGYTLVTKKDIWNYLVDNDWKNRTNLELYDLISDIMNADNYKINLYVIDKLSRMKSKLDKTNNTDIL